MNPRKYGFEVGIEGQKQSIRPGIRMITEVPWRSTQEKFLYT